MLAKSLLCIKNYFFYNVYEFEVSEHAIYLILSNEFILLIIKNYLFMFIAITFF